MRPLLDGHRTGAGIAPAAAHRWHAASLATRLVTLFVAGSAFIMLAAGFELYHALLAQREASEAAELGRKARAAEHLLRSLDEAGGVEANLIRIRDLALGYPQLSIGVIADGRWLMRPRNEALVAALDRAAPASGAFSTASESGARHWRVRRVRHAAADGIVDVILALEASRGGERQYRAAILGGLIALTGTVAAALLALFAVHRGLTPLREFVLRARAAGTQASGRRLPLQHLPREVRALAETLNAMLGRLEEGFACLEQLSADIAHEVRTPLNNMLVETQVTLSRPRSAGDYREALQANLEEIERLQRMVSELLFLVRAERGLLPLAVEELDLAAEAAAVADYFEAVASDKSQAIALTGAATIRADRSLARRAISSLVCDALRASPPGARVDVEVAIEQDAAVLRVTRPGQASQAELGRLLDGLDRHGQPHDCGAGLALAIAAAIMRLHGGCIGAASAVGKVTFALRFPLGGRPALGPSLPHHFTQEQL